MDNVERHLRKFRKEYSLIHEWFVQTDHELRKIENKQVSKNTREEVDWIRVKISRPLLHASPFQLHLFRQHEIIFEKWNPILKH